MSATVTQSHVSLDQELRAERAQQSYQYAAAGLHALRRTFKRAGTAIGNALMRWAVAYEATAQERIMRELALSHPSLVADIRAARAEAAAASIRRSPVLGMWE